MSAPRSSADLQIHTRASDGLDDAAAILRAAESRGLDCIAITEHDDVAGAFSARETAERAGSPVHVIIGSEITSRSGHILGLWLDEPVPMLRSAPETVSAIWRQGGVAVIAHPLAWFPPSLGARAIDRLLRDLAPELAAGDAVLALETANPHPTARWRRDRLLQLNRERWRLPETGGSDAHFAEHVGAAATLYDGSDPEALRAALASRETRADLIGLPPWREVGLRRILAQPLRGMTSTPAAALRRRRASVKRQ